MEEMNNEMMIKLAMVILKSNMLQTNYSFSSPPGNSPGCSPGISSFP